MLKMQIALFFADGRAYFAGIVLVGLALAMLAGRKTRKPSKSPRIMLIVGAITILLSSTPAPIWFYILWLLATSAWLVQQAQPLLKKGPRVALFVAAFGFCFLAAGMEVPYRHLPTLGSDTPKRLYVIGDSISSGIGSGEVAWPKVLASSKGIEVFDLSSPGATAQTALTQAQRIPAEPAVIIVEIGGNDLLGGASNSEFERDLRRLLETLRSPSRRIVMFELPLPPFSNGYGRIQRSLASEFGVTLIPKNVLAHVLGSARGTLDGLHLSEEGHREIADTVRKVVGINTAASSPSP
jgi:acyl-CoA thioesterase I